MSAKECKELVKDLNLEDLDDILMSKSLNPKVFVTYLRMIKIWQIVQKECNKIIDKS